MKFTRHCLIQWISKLQRNKEIKDLQKSEITAKPKSNLYVAPVNIFLIFDTELQLVFLPILRV